MTITVNGRTIATTAIAAMALLAAYLLGAVRPSSAGAATTTSAGGTAAAAATTDSGVTVTGTGTVTGTPDTLRIALSVTATASGIDAALGSANRSARAVQGALSAQGVAARDLKTSGLSIQPNYTSKGEPSGYRVDESITASLRDLAKAGATLSAAVAAGGNAVRVDGVSVALEDTDSLVTGARTAAVDDARAKAEQYAKAAGRTLGEVRSISEVVQQPTPLAFDSRFAAAVPASAVPIQPGSQDVTVAVTVVYDLT
jgi:uncharacterized protein YggE